MNFRLDYDHAYGLQQLCGRSVAIDGAYVVQFEPWLAMALWKAWRKHRE